MELRETAGFASRKREVKNTFSLQQATSISARKREVKRETKNTSSVHQAFARKLKRRLVAFTIVLAITLSLLYITERSDFISTANLENFVRDAGPWGPVALIFVIGLISFSLTIPASPLIVLAGALYDPYWGTLYAMAGLLIGWSIAFAIARTFRGPIIRLLGEHAEFLTRFQDRFIGTFLFVTRAFPIFSFEIISYAAGLTTISYSRYLLASLGAIAPIFVLAFLGSAGKHVIFASRGVLPFIMTGLFIVFIFVVPLAIDHYNPYGWKEKFLQTKQIPKRGTK